MIVCVEVTCPPRSIEAIEVVPTKAFSLSPPFGAVTVTSKLMASPGKAEMGAPETDKVGAGLMSSSSPQLTSKRGLISSAIFQMYLFIVEWF